MTDEFYKQQDKIVEITLTNIYSLSKEKGKIVLTNFNPKDENHLFFFHVAMIVRDMFQYPIEVDLGFFKTLLLNWKLRKHYVKVARYRGVEKGIDVEEVLSFMRPTMNEMLGAGHTYADIYNDYYSGREILK